MTQFRPIRGVVGTDTQDALLRVTEPEPQLSRTYYQDGRLLTAEALNRDQAYYDRRLLDLGLARGDGIASGLEAALSGSTLTVQPGVGIAPSGRVLSYTHAGAALMADLADAGLQATLNGAGFGGLSDGLYACVLLHSQAPQGVAEIFPRTLTQRGRTAESIVDQVEIALVPMAAAAPDGSAFQARAHLARTFALAQAPALPADALALGVLAVRRGLPLWFDPELLRHPLRLPGEATAPADDLTRQYARLYDDLMAARALEGVRTFRFADIASLLPPSGKLPAAAIDPAAGSQTFFPETVDVSIVPIRADELPSLLDSVRGEPALDLTRTAGAQILVLAPLSAGDYAAYAPALLGTPAAANPPAFRPAAGVNLPALDRLALRLPGRGTQPPARPEAWAALWPHVPPTLSFIVRPSDGGGLGATVAMLAAGYVPAAAPVAADDARVTALAQQLKDAQAATVAATAARDDALAQAKAAADAQAKAGGDLSAQLADLRAKLDAATAQAATSAQAANAAQSQLAQANQAQAASAAQVGGLQSQLNAANTQVAALEAHDTALNGQVASLRAEVIALRAGDAGPPIRPIRPLQNLPNTPIRPLV